MARFEDAIDLILEQEGGLVDHEDDPGGLTNFGITIRQYPELDIRALTRDDAKLIYFHDYWRPNKIHLINDQAIANKYFSFVVNMGARSAGRIMQRALRAVDRRARLPAVEDDGWVGPKTRTAMNKLVEDGGGFIGEYLAAIRSEAAGHYRLLIEKNPRLVSFRRGWMNRAYE